MIYCLRTVGVSARDWFGEVRRPALCAVGMGIVVAGCRLALLRVEGLSTASLLAAQVAVGAVTYAILARKEVRWFVDQLRLLRGGATR